MSILAQAVVCRTAMGIVFGFGMHQASTAWLRRRKHREEAAGGTVPTPLQRQKQILEESDARYLRRMLEDEARVTAWRRAMRLRSAFDLAPTVSNYAAWTEAMEESNRLGRPRPPPTPMPGPGVTRHGNY